MRLPRLVCAAALAACVAAIACGGREAIEPIGTIDSTTPPPDAGTTQQALQARWNAAASSAAAGGQITIDFHWTSYDQFPHPTIKGGTADAYRQFATVLVLFFQSADDFSFLSSNHLFETPLRYIYPSGQIGVDTTFQKLATDFTSGPPATYLPISTQQAIKGFLDRMN